ncbi:putative ATP-dependent RNA helicase DDX20 [Salarias fasciatus]|nr:probable ATP-dependent RNA helicase DDX20 [Salarias fasciatus]XP_029974166.1 probable ATP-dependent RNA helicase DDX20 [Salarias fasciatus]
MAAPVRKAAHDIETRKRTEDVLLSEGIDFASLLLSPAVLAGLSSAGFQKPSPIQLKAIPLGRCGLDLIVQAKSGTGKTCVFCTIALDSLVLENPATQVLVLAPTREIAVQIHSVVMAIGCAMEGLECHVFIGGRPVSQDKAHLKKCHIAVGSPGRIKQLIEMKMLSTSSIRLFVLDEADKLLEEGSFQEQINWIFSSLPATKQMLALSATYPEYLAQQLTRYMQEPTFVRLNPSDMGLKGLKQYYKLVQSHSVAHRVFEEKVQHLLELFSKVPFNQALVFSNLHTRAQHLADILTSKGLPAVCISGGLTQDQRLEAMSKLKQYQCRVLISTDLTSRGIDAEKVNLVINLDVPQDWETYMHRIGRAGRFGTQGLAVTYCCHGEEENKMLAIAQKCSLTLSLLPSTIEPGLMDEPCDWDVCTEASRPGLAFQLFPRAEKKKRTKEEVSVRASTAGQTEEHSSRRTLEKTRPALRRGGQDETFAERSPSADASPPAAPTRQELQDALPKIPPLSSFKRRETPCLTFAEAERDFQDFLTTGPGRSVEIIREFRGRDDEDETGQSESVTLYDDDDRPPGLPQRDGRRESNAPPLRLRSDHSSFDCDMEESHEDDQSQTTGDDTSRTWTSPTTSTAPKTYEQTQWSRAAAPAGGTGSAPSIKSNRPTNRTTPAQTRSDESKKVKKETGKRSKKHSEKMETESRRQMDEEDCSDKEEEEWSSAETYWRACYRAWNDYYASMSSFQEPPYQNYYNTASNWMAAYRMNAVYMQELMRN